jgi:SAM-dependent methyltransferase
MSLRDWFKSPPAAPAAEPVSTPAVAAPADFPDAVPPASAVDLAFWIVLWRAPGVREVEEWHRTPPADADVANLFRRLVASSEFRLVLYGVLEDHYTGRLPREVEAGLQRLGDNVSFLEWSFRALLGREVDPSGRAFYLDQLAGGFPRTQLLKALVSSDEFAGRYRTICPQAGFVPRDVQLCELANPAKWGNPDWMALLSSLVVQPADQLSMHRKGYEFTQLLFGLTRLGFIRDDVKVLSVGAGHEAVLYWLANRVGYVVATDMYGGVWQSHGAREGDESVIGDPSQFAPFPYRQDRLVFLKMDGTALAFPDESFDVVYSLSSIEHFGGLEGASRAVDEMARVLKPGGVLALATEYILKGPPHHEAFMPEQVRVLLQHPRLSLMEPVDERVWDRYEYTPIDLRVNPLQTPHMVVTDNGSVFTSVMAFLRKKDVEAD